MSFPQVTRAEDQPVPKRSPSNRRTFVRYQCGLATPGRIKLEGDEWQRGWVLDLCLNGVGLLLSRPLEPGTKIVVHLVNAAQKKIRELQSFVRHVSLQPDGDWIVGCEFTAMLSHDELDELLQ